MEEGRKGRGDFAIGVSSLLFAAGAIVVKLIADQGFSGWFISAMRFAVGAALCALAMKATRSSFKVHGAKDVVLRGIFGALAMVLYFLSIEFTGAGRATLFNTVYPLFVVIFGAVFFKERASRFQLISLAISFAGVLLALWDGGEGNLLGDLLGIASSVSAGFSVHYSKRARARNNSWNIYLWVCMAGLLATIWSAPEIAIAFGAGGERGPAGGGFAAILILALSASIYFAAQIAFTWGLKFTSAANAGILSFLKVPLAIAFGALFMGEAIGTRFVLGGTLVTAGILVLELEGRFGKGKAIA